MFTVIASVPLFGEAKEKLLYDRLGKSPCTYHGNDMKTAHNSGAGR